MNNKIIYISGATGFIGLNLLNYLKKKKYKNINSISLKKKILKIIYQIIN